MIMCRLYVRKNVWNRDNSNVKFVQKVSIIGLLYTRTNLYTLVKVIGIANQSVGLFTRAQDCLVDYHAQTVESYTLAK